MKLSIITVALNNAVSIEDTICSILSQSYPDIEYIIIDGGSSDGTQAIIERYSHKITKVVSEPDQGMYDAMNKGISIARGDIVGILNADDIYNNSGILQQVADSFVRTGADACYGDLVYVDQNAPSGHVVRLWRAGEYSRYKLYLGWMPPHPTFFVKRSCYISYGGYRVDMGTSADYELMLRYLLCHNVVPTYIPQQIVKMRIGGISNRSLLYRLKAHQADWRSWRVNHLCPFPWTLPLKPLTKVHQWFMRG